MKRLTILAVLAALAATGCDSLSIKKKEEDLSEKARVAAENNRTGPKSPVVKNITNFSSALRCMDEKMMMYGIRDLTIITEDIEDKTKKVSVGAKDMLISAVSQMTQRSQAIRLIAYGTDSANLINFMTQREEKGLYQLSPVYGIRGSISQYDESMTKENAGGGLFFRNNTVGTGIGASANASASMLGLDLTMMRTADMTVVPGVSSSNAVVIIRSGSGASIEAEIKKFGMNYEMNLSQSEGVAQATRNLIDLAVIELFGKLTKTPYWTCLGGSTSSPAVKNEIDSWYYNLFSDRATFVAYWQNQMRLRGLYNKPVNGVPDEELTAAVEIYREALGLEKNAKLDPQLFAVYLNANHYKVMEKAKRILAARQTAAAAGDNVPPPPSPRPRNQVLEKVRKVVDNAAEAERRGKPSSPSASGTETRGKP